MIFDGNIPNVTIRNTVGEGQQAEGYGQLFQVVDVPLQKRARTLSSSSSTSPSSGGLPLGDCVGFADLTLQPGACKAFTFSQIPRDAGSVELQSIILCLESPDFDLEVIITEVEQMDRDTFVVLGDSGPSQVKLQDGRSTTVKVLPKPPKIRMSIENLATKYFINENILVQLRVLNGEDGDAEVTVEARLLGPTGLFPQMTWIQDGDQYRPSEIGSIETSSDQQKGPTQSKPLGIMVRKSEQNHILRIEKISEPTDYVLEVRARYHLITDPETPMVKSFSANVSVALPFEASYNFVPMIHPEPWPSYFEADDLNCDYEARGEGFANGLRQTWSLTSRVYSLADVPLTIRSIKPHVLGDLEDSICSIRGSGINTKDVLSIVPSETEECTFILEVQKRNLDDRRSTFLDLGLEIEWCRRGYEDSSTICHMAVPELNIPFGEPRVLATVRSGQTSFSVVKAEYTIENPSMYTLVFNSTMETSEELSFSGAKNTSIQLLPLSRHAVSYNLMPLAKGTWISPQFKVFDTHFHKMLKVHATEGMRIDRQGISFWVDAEE